MAPLATTDTNFNKSSLSSSSSLPQPESVSALKNRTISTMGVPLAAPSIATAEAATTANTTNEDNVCSLTAFAAAATADEDVNNSGDDKSADSKRFLPAYKKPNAALTFPEKMMNLMKYANEMGQKEKQFCVSWLPDGKAFVIYDIKDFTNDVIPKFFKASKFCSFTRKLYRWGFRQLNRGVGPDEPIIFGNEFFQKDNADLMVNMRSITAASIRKRESNLLRHMLASKKRALLSWNDGGGGSDTTATAAAAIQQQDLKQHERQLLASAQQQQKMAHHQNALAAAAACGGGNGGVHPPMPSAASNRFGGLGLGLGANGGHVGGGGAGGGSIIPTDLSHMTNDQLQELYRTCAASAANVGGAVGAGPVFSDALSQVGAGSNLLPQLGNFNSGNCGGAGGVLPSSYLPQDFNSVLPSSLSGMNMHNGQFNNLINNNMFDINTNNINGDFNGLNGNHLNTGMNSHGNQINNNSTFNNNNPPFPFNFGNNSTNMLPSDLALFGNNHMNKQQQHGGNLNLNLHFQQNGTVKDAAGILPTPFETNNVNNNNIGTNNMNHQNILNRQVSAAAAAAAAATGGPGDLSMLYARQQKQQ